MTGKAGSILIVDDNKSILTALKLLLGNYFNRVVTLPAPTALVSRSVRKNSTWCCSI